MGPDCRPGRQGSGWEHSPMRGVPFPGLSFGGAYEDTYSVGADL